MLTTIEISLLVALVGCFVTLAGYLSKRDDKLVDDAQWKGKVDTKLDLIIGMNAIITDHEKRITKLESEGT